jgi:hypothetical protein
MKKLPVLALVSALVLAGALVFWLLRAGSNSPSESATIATTSPAADALAARDGEARARPLEDDASHALDAGGEKRAGAAKDADAVAAWDPAQTVWVTGSVRTQCADDGPLEVFALSGEADSETVLLESARLKKDKDAFAKVHVIARAPVAPDGGFKLGCPPDKKRVYVSVLGKYHYLPDAQAVDLDKGNAPLVLTPQLGAWITATLVPPDDDVRAESIADLDVELTTSVDGLRGSIFTMRRIDRSAKLHDGAIEFRAVPVESNYDVTVTPEKLAAARLSLKNLIGGRATPIELRLQRGGVVRGIVKDSSGAPVADAKVAAALPGRWFGADDKSVRSVHSAADGAFELAAVTPGRIVLRATRDTYLDSDPVKIDLADGGTANDAVLVLSHGKSVSGTVTWPDTRPAAGVDVDLKFDLSQMYGMGAFNAMRGAKGNAKTDAQGAFEIGGLGDGPFTLEADAPPPESSSSTTPASSAPAASATEVLEEGDSLSPKNASKNAIGDKRDKKTFWHARADGVASGAKSVSLVLRAPEGLAGKVVDETGAPVTKFKVVANRMGKGPLASLGQEKRSDAFDDAHGAFVLGGLQEGHWKVVATADGFAQSDPLEVDVPKKPDAQDVVIALVHGATVKGVVKTPTGAPIADAEIAIDNGKPNWQNMLDSSLAPPKAKSQPDGTFEIDGLKPGKTSLYAKHKSLARSPSVAFDLAPSQHVDGAELVLREGGQLTGEVFGDNGAPAVGHMVQASETKVFDQQMTFSDGRGQFEIDHLEPGTWQVVAMPTGNSDASSSSADDSRSGDGGKSGDDAQKNVMEMVSKMKTAIIDIKDGEKTHVVLGAPPADPVHVFGRVTHAGAPYGGAMMTFMAAGKGKPRTPKTTTVDKDGNYSVKLDEPGDYDVSVQKIFGTGQQNVVEFASEIPKEKEHKLDFALPTARISGRVSGPEGDPAPGVRVSLHPETHTPGTMWGGQYSESATDADGRFDIPALRPGTYTLLVGGMAMGGLFGGDENAFGRQMRGDLRLGEGEWMKDVDFRMKKSGAIDVEVADDSGAPVGEAALFVRNKDGKLLDRVSLIQTDANGKCKYGGLEPGTYSLSARKGSVASTDSPQVRVEAGQHASAKLVLTAGTMLIVDVFDGENKPVKASLSVQDQDGREVGGMLGLSEIMKMFSSGSFDMTQQHIGPLPPGKYTVRATIADGKSLTKPVTLSGQAERSLSIRFM